MKTFKMMLLACALMAGVALTASAQKKGGDENKGAKPPTDLGQKEGDGKNKGGDGKKGGDRDKNKGGQDNKEVTPPDQLALFFRAKLRSDIIG